MPSHAMGASLKHLVLITQYHGSSDSLSNKDEDDMDILFLSLRYEHLS